MDQSNTHNARLLAMVARLDLDRLTWADQLAPDDPARALEQLSSRLLRLYGEVFSTFIKAHLKEFPPETPMDDKEIEAHLDQVMREKVVSITRFLMRKHLAGDGPQSLAEAARRVYKDNASFSKNKSELIKSVEDSVRFLGVWNVDRDYRKTGPGKNDEQISRYNLSPGPVLLAFHTLVYTPYAAKAVAMTNAVLSNHPQIMGGPQ